jgi:penicillin-binding protein 2
MLDFLSSAKNNKGKINLSFKEDVEPHEILLDSLARKREEEFGFSEKRLEVPILKKIIQGMFIFCLLLISFLLLKTFQLQVVQGEEFVKLAERNKFIVHQIQAERGVIYDRNMEQLVFNRSTFDFVCPDEKIENLSHEQLVFLEARTDQFPECQIITNTVREYKDSQIFAHVLGYMGKITEEEFKQNQDVYLINDYLGRTGLEDYYEQDLRKNPGQVKIERDALGNLFSEQVVSLPESGNSLVLWLDAGLQRKAYQELEKKYKEFNAKGGTVVALDPKTGGVLSLVSLPSFDNNLFQKGSDSELLQNILTDPKKTYPLFNRAISGRYLTGSTIKPLTAIAALEEKIINPEKQIYGSAYLEIPHRYDPSISYKFRDWTVHGWVDMRKAIAQSCNIYFYTIGGGYQDQKGLGPTKIKEYLELFGWAEKTGIDLSNEINGFIPDLEWKRNVLKEGWWDGDTYHLSIGQGYIQITPLEIAYSYLALANQGKLYQPKVVKEIIGVKEIEPEIVRQNFVDSKNIEIVRQGMRQAVTGVNSPQASALILNSLPVSAAAKTGTAELGNDRYHNWVTVFAPYDDPEIVLTVMLEDVKGLQAAALPIAREILEWYFSKEEK